MTTEDLAEIAGRASLVAASYPYDAHGDSMKLACENVPHLLSEVNMLTAELTSQRALVEAMMAANTTRMANEDAVSISVRSIG